MTTTVMTSPFYSEVSTKSVLRIGRKAFRPIARALTAVSVLLAAACLPGPAWGQWSNISGGIWYGGGNVGIGTMTPSTLLHVFANSGNPKITVEGGSAAMFPLFQLMDDRTGGVNWNIENGREGLGVLGFRSNYAPAGTRVVITHEGNVGIGTTNPQYLLSVKGTIGAQEFIVTNTGWSDYVFCPGYRLRPLREVAAYIQTNHHLPDIPSEAEVKAQGVNVGKMQAKLLAKVEELTLHMIQAEKENQELRDRLARLEKSAARHTATEAK